MFQKWHLNAFLTINTHQSTYWKRTLKLKIGFILSGLSATSFFVERFFAKKIWTQIYLCPFFLFASKLLGFASRWQKVKKKMSRRCFENGSKTKYLVYVLFQINYIMNKFSAKYFKPLFSSKIQNKKIILNFIFTPLW